MAYACRHLSPRSSDIHSILFPCHKVSRFHPGIGEPAACGAGCNAPRQRACPRLSTIISALQILALTAIIIGVLIVLGASAVSRAAIDDAQSGLLGRGGYTRRVLGNFAGFLRQALPMYRMLLYQNRRLPLPLPTGPFRRLPGSPVLADPEMGRHTRPAAKLSGNKYSSTNEADRP
jgi:hypothetical protein